MLYDNLAGLARVAVVGPLAYVWLIFVLRLSGKRTLAQMSAFDFIVTVALGSTLATVALTESVAWAEGALALVLLAILQLCAAWASAHVSWARGVLTSEPKLLLQHGQPIHSAMLSERISIDSVLQAVRSAGIGGIEQAAAVVLETNGKLSVVAAGKLGSGSALPAWPNLVSRS